MPLQSMTGFARAEGADERLRWTFEARSVNAKGLDLRFRMPPGFEAVEQGVRTMMRERFSRGSVQISLSVARSASAQTMKINRDALAEVLAAMAEIEGEFETAPPTLDGILRIKGVFDSEEEDEDEDARTARIEAMLSSAGEMIEALAEARSEEGARLDPVIGGQIDQIDGLTGAAASVAATQPETLRAKLEAALERLLDERAASLDPDRLAQEVALLAVKADVSEELDRLAAHVAAARDLMAKDEPIGRRFDFLAQEFNREANTLCSKSTDPELTRIGVELKTVIDQMREQIQNVE